MYVKNIAKNNNLFQEVSEVTMTNYGYVYLMKDVIAFKEFYVKEAPKTY